MARDRDNLRKMIQEFGFGAMEDELMSFARPSIRIYTKPVEDEEQIPIGASKIGGRPDLPRHINWMPVNQDKPVSLPFIGQFNLKDVKTYDFEDLLPAKGILYFFADPFCSPDKDTGHAFFFDGDPELLERKPFPDDIPANIPFEQGERYHPCAIEFVSEVNLPFFDANWKEPTIYPEGKTWQDFYEILYAASYTQPSPPHDRTVNRLLGYNYDIPSDLQLDCELTIKEGSPYVNSWEMQAKYEESKARWQLLFQMDSDHNARMMWSDSGSICFYIPREDLLVRNFDNVCLAFFTA